MGETCRIQSDQFHTGASTHDVIQIDNPGLSKAVRPSDNITFDNGTITAVVLETELDYVKV